MKALSIPVAYDKPIPYRGKLRSLCLYYFPR